MDEQYRTESLDHLGIVAGICEQIGLIEQIDACVAETGRKVSAGLIQDWELRILGSLMYIGDDYREAIRLLTNGQVNINHLVTHRYPLSEAKEAFSKALERGRVLKVLLLN